MEHKGDTRGLKVRICEFNGEKVYPKWKKSVPKVEKSVPKVKKFGYDLKFKNGYMGTLLGTILGTV